MEGDIGDLSENIERDVKSEGSLNSKASQGLEDKLLTSETLIPGEEEGRVVDDEGRDIKDEGREG